MSYLQNPPWTTSEKVDLLVNILQGSLPDLPAFLLGVMHDHGVFPNWNNMALPKGRSLHSSQTVYDEMSRMYRPPGRPLPQQMPLPYNPAPAYSTPLQRSFPEQDPYQTQQRAIAPRPTHPAQPARATDSPAPTTVTNGDVPPIHRPLAPEPPPENRKKRGRPSKEEVEERDRMLAAEGKVHQPRKRATKKLRASTSTPGPESEVAGTQIPAAIHTPKAQTAEGREQALSGGSLSKGHLREEVPGSQTKDESKQDSPSPQDKQSEDRHSVVPSPSDRLLASHRDRESSQLGLEPPQQHRIQTEATTR